MDLSGWLHKRQPSGLVRAWQKRYFALDLSTSVLAYGIDEHDAMMPSSAASSSRKAVDLSRIVAVLQEQPKLQLRRGGWYIQLQTEGSSGRVWELWVEDAETGHLWAQGLEDAVAQAKQIGKGRAGKQQRDGRSLLADADAMLQIDDDELMNDTNRGDGGRGRAGGDDDDDDDDDDDPDLLRELDALAGVPTSRQPVVVQDAAQTAQLDLLTGEPEAPIRRIPGIQTTYGQTKEGGEDEYDDEGSEQEHDPQTEALLGAAADLMAFSSDEDEVGDTRENEDDSADEPADDVLTAELAAAEERAVKRRREVAQRDRKELAAGLGAGGGTDDEVVTTEASFNVGQDAANEQGGGDTDLLAELHSLNSPSMSLEELSREADSASAKGQTPAMLISTSPPSDSAGVLRAFSIPERSDSRNDEQLRYIEDLHVTYRKLAVAYKKRGDLEGARSVLQHYKKIDAILVQAHDIGIDELLQLQPKLLDELPPPPRAAAAREGSAEPSNALPDDKTGDEQTERDDKIRKLALMLKRQLESNIADAKAASAANDRAKAKELKAENARMLEDLKQLQTALSDKTVAPPKFHVEKKELREIIRNSDIPDDTLEIRLGALRFAKYPPPEFDSSSTNDASAPYAISKFPYPQSDEPQIFQTPVVETVAGDDGKHAARLAHKGRVKILRNRATMSKALEKRSLTVEVWQRRTILADYLIGKAAIPLVELLKHSDYTVEAAVIASKAGRPRLTSKNLVGHLDVYMRLSRPIDEGIQDVRITTKTTLVIDEHMKSGSFITQAAKLKAEAAKRAQVETGGPPSPNVGDDWDSLDLIVSYDALEAEVARCAEMQQKLANNPFDATEWESRGAQARVKMTTLEVQMQTGSLDMEDYLAQITTAVERTMAMALVLKRDGRKEDVLVLLRRAKIMKNEIQVTREGGEEEEEEEQQG